MSDRDNINSIVEIIKGYRENEISPIDYDHVDKWVTQFDPSSRSTILREMKHILENHYLSKERTYNLLKNILKKQEIFGNIEESYQELQFIMVDQNGSSQNALLSLMSEILEKEYELSLEDFGENAQRYIYIDDCVYSGNTAYYDLEDWVKDNGDGKELHLVFLAAYSRGFHQLKKRLNKFAENNNIDIEIHGWSCKHYQNFVSNYSRYDCCWPYLEEEYEEDSDIKDFTTKLEEENSNFPPRLYRDVLTLEERLFTSAEGRKVVEREFLKAGAYITKLPKEAHKSMKPLGYEFFGSLGFGSMFITYRNIANNCPLALWWGDTSMPESHPFSKWHPLLPRRINEEKFSLNWFE